MGTHDDMAGYLRALQDGQRAFWRAAADATAFPDASVFAPPEWQAFDGFATELLARAPGDDGPDWQRALTALAAYRDVIAATWARIRTEFEVHRRALQGLGDPDWRIVRDRWFQIAEAEFIRTLRSDTFVTAQRDLLRAALGIWSDLPDPVRTQSRLAWQGTGLAADTTTALALSGVTIAETPKDRVWAEGRTTLYRYRPLGPAPGLGPVLVAHGLIGRQSMTDLQPDRSMVRMLLAAGVDVFMLDWGNAAPDDAGLGLDHFAGDQMGKAVAAARRAAGQDIVLMGVCQGGTLAACHAARFGDGLKGLITAVAPFDFHADRHDPDPAHGLLNLWIRSLDHADIDALTTVGPNVPGHLIAALFNGLNPVRTLAKYAIHLPERGLEPGGLRTFLAMEKWLADRPDLPGALARTWLGALYKDNALMHGRLRLSGQPVDLTKIAVPVMNIFASNDHITPPPCSRALAAQIAAPYEELAIPSGHIGTFVSAGAQTLLSPSITSWLSRNG